MKLLVHSLTVVLFLTTGPVSVAESDGWRTICTAVPGKKFDYCKISRTVVHKFEDGTSVKVLLVVGFQNDARSEARTRVNVSTQGRPLIHASIRVDARGYDKTTRCEQNSCSFIGARAGTLKTMFDYGHIAHVKLRMHNPYGFADVRFALKGYQEEYNKTAE